MQTADNTIKRDFATLLAAVYDVSTDAGDRLDEMFRLAREEPLSPEEAARLVREVVAAIRKGAEERGDTVVVERLSGDIDSLVQRILASSGVQSMASTAVTSTKDSARRAVTFPLKAHNGIEPAPILPTPIFQGRPVPMMGGFVDVKDVKLWDENARLDIHLQQFNRQYGRDPSDAELLDIILGRMPLLGVGDVRDEFEIDRLARSIAQNGVRKPPILDVDGTPLDGNRRLAACRKILESGEYNPEQKARASRIFVWQLTEHAIDDDRRVVEVSLNFEADCKLDWPEYVKARKVFEDWETALAHNSNAGPKELAKLKKEISKQYALGPDPEHVNRYIKMVAVANEFEEYHRNERGRDEFEVKHKADHYFQYFDELSKGVRKGGVSFVLDQNDALRHLTFDLLYDGKFKNWPQIRLLKHVATNQDAIDALKKARDEKDRDTALDLVDNAMAIAKATSAESRQLGANTRIETFVEFIEQLPVSAFRDVIKPENLRKLQRALALVDGYVKAVLGSDAGKTTSPISESDAGKAASPTSDSDGGKATSPASDNDAGKAIPPTSGAE